jgi:hypothetical protein
MTSLPVCLRRISVRARLLRTGLVAIVGIATACGVAAPQASAATSAAHYPVAGSAVPDADPFYAAPGNLSSYRPGAVVGSRPVTAQSFGGATAVTAWQVSFRSNDVHNRPELAITTLVVPNTPWQGLGQRPVVSVQSPEDGLGTQCAPSYLVATGNDSQDAALAENLLLAGYAITLPDHEGPQSVYEAGPEQGHVVLDGIRAVKHFAHDGIGTGNPWALSGYSGGATATGWAAQLQPSYAPDVHLVGAASGGTPADQAAVGRSLDGGVFSGFELAASVGIGTAWPESGITNLLNPAGKAAFADLKGKCENAIISGYAGKKFADYSTVADPLTVPSVKKVLDADTLGATPPATPVYDYHANTDEIVPVAQDNTLVQRWCAEGAKVVKVRDPAGEHVEESVFREPAVLAWLTARFQGLPVVTSTC